MLLHDSSRTKSLLELSNLHYIATVVVESACNCRLPHRSPNVWTQSGTQARYSVSHPLGYDSIKADMLPVKHTCTVPGEMWAGFLTHTHTFSHTLWKNTKGLSEQRRSRHTLLPLANLFISAPVSRLRPAWHTAQFSTHKPYMTRIPATVVVCSCVWSGCLKRTQILNDEISKQPH